MKMNVQIQKIEKMIYILRGQKVMLDIDLARLYEVETKHLNRQINRNRSRFPEDFSFRITNEEWKNLRCQIGTSSLEHGGRRYLPFVFTENGVAMLSSVLKSERAVQVNISIMRIFTKLRSFLLLEKELTNRVDTLEQGTNKMFKIVFERLDNIEEIITPKLAENRRKIGLKN